MPLPTSDQVWPPTDPRVQTAMADWDAWYSSDRWRLEERYVERGIGGFREVPTVRPGQLRGGLVGTLSRWFWGNPMAAGEKDTKLHIPIAADIARTSSELLFSAPPNLVSDHKGTQKRLDDLVACGLHPTLLEGAEIGSAIGGNYLRLVWDDTVADEPWIDTVAADTAVPEFSYNKLKAVTFWQLLDSGDDKIFYRHLQRHERGVIYNGLYKGTRTQLGKPVSLNAMPDTTGLQPLIETGAPKNLTASYIPNVRPARAWRHIPTARGLGQSDFQGIEGPMDALDEAWSSWMRDIRLGKGRVVVPNSMLDSGGPGQGAAWNSDREIYTGLNMLQRPGDSNTLTVVQFAIRYQEHSNTCQELTELIIRQAGYSGATFGMDTEGGAMTATEVEARESRSLTTRDRKIVYQTPGIADITAAWLAVMAGPLFRTSGLDLTPPTVEFPDSINASPQEVATTVQLLAAAEAASTEVKVRMVHPDWDDQQVEAEVAAIQDEGGHNVADPTQIGNELPQPFPPDPTQQPYSPGPGQPPQDPAQTS